MMTTPPMALPTALEPPPRQSRLGEFLAVGGLTPFLFPLSLLIQKSFGLDASELAAGFITFHAAFIINDPHFAVTYILFYKDIRSRSLGGTWTGLQRLRYLAAGFLVPLLLGAWSILALSKHSPYLLGLLIQLMFLLVGWHYVKQGFGALSVLSARRGVRFTPAERFVFLAHCYAGWAYAWASPFDPGRLLEEKGVVYRSMAHPPGLERLTQWIFLATIVPLVFVLARKWRREKHLPLLTPLCAFLCSIWLWSIYSSIDPLIKYMIPALHSVQYLYFVWMLKGNEARERQGPPWFERSAGTRMVRLAVASIGLGWLLFRGIPGLLDTLFVPRHLVPEEGSLGPTPYFAAIYACVNIHHYFMDTVIWRRENPETRYLRAQGGGEGRGRGMGKR